MLGRLVSLSSPSVLSSVLPGLLSLLASLITTTSQPSQITTDALTVRGLAWKKFKSLTFKLDFDFGGILRDIMFDF